MRRSVMTVFFLCALLIPSGVYADQAARVKILPFAVHAESKLGYLKTSIPQELEKHLNKEGAQAFVSLDMALDRPDPSRMDLTALRQMGVKAKADYLVWGSFSKVGKRYSIDAKILSTFVESPIMAVYVEGEGMHTLIDKVSQLGADVAAKVMGRKKVVEILVSGNNRIEADAVLKAIKTSPGDIFSPRQLAKDIRTIFAMGYFEDIRVEAKDVSKGKRITFIVQEKSTLHVIKLKGNKKIKDEDISTVMDISRGSILNDRRIKENIKKIEALYKEENFHNAKITYEITPYKEHLADLNIIISEGGKVLIKKISFEGSKAFSNRKLKKLMKTSEKGFFSWITDSGNLNADDLSQDRATLHAHYHNNGYVQAVVSEPEMEVKDKWIYITIKIKEGEQFKIGKVDLEVPEGHTLILPKKDILSELKIGEEKVFSAKVMHRDVLILTDIYQDDGYAYADIFPKTQVDPEKRMVNVIFFIDKGQQVYFERILITGNTKTREKVIRRELPIHERGLYSGSLLKRGVRNLIRLDFFGDIKVDTVKGSADDKMILKIGVEEKPTGSFTFGGGYSNIDNAFAMASIGQRNLFGKGQSLQFKAQVGGSSNRFTLSFTEPWLFDSRLSAGFDIYNWNRDYDTYEKNSQGGAIRTSYPVFDYTRLYLSYRFEQADIRNVDWFAAEAIRDLEGTNVESSVSSAIARDTRNRPFNATAGNYEKLSLEYAGNVMGGDIAFIKYVAEGGIYFPLFWNTVGFFHAKGGFVEDNPGGVLPIYERFYLGGINSLRGFTWEDLSPLDKNGARIGGNKFVQFNLEYHVPIIKNSGLVGILFLDMGDVYNNGELVNMSALRESAGFGIRWFSPMGPIRLERGYIINPQGWEDSDGRWEFTMGGAF